MANLTAHDVAKYFLAQVSEDYGDTVSNLKLQKLVYYAQGFCLALLDRPLFDDVILAWEHGPVVSSLYAIYKASGSGAIRLPNDVDFDIYSAEERLLLGEVNEVYGQFSAWKLRNMTHNEPPWKDTPLQQPISHEAMKKYFRTLVASS